MPVYAQPPLVERIVEFRTAKDGPDDVLDRLMGRLRGDYPAYEDQLEVAFEVTSANTVETKGSGISQRTLRSADATDICLLKRNSIGVSRTAPYTGWSDLRSRAERAWKVWQKEMVRPKLSRLGGRSTNRIDVPIELAAAKSPQDFVSIGFHALPFAADVKAFAVSRSGTLDRYEFTLQSSTFASPLIDHISILLDIDLGLSLDPPTAWDDIAREMDVMSNLLTTTFEALVTDEARALFNPR